MILEACKYLDAQIGGMGNCRESPSTNFMLPVKVLVYGSSKNNASYKIRICREG